MLVRKQDGTMAEVVEVINSPKQFANNLAQDLNANSGVSNLGNGKVVEMFPIPPSLSFTCTSPNSGAAVDQYIFNNNSYRALTASNGADPIVSSYGDGWGGKGYEQLLRSAKGGNGILIKGFTIKATTIAGVLDSTFFTTANLTVLFTNLKNAGVLPADVDLDMAVRNTAFKDGILTVVYPFVLNCLSQLKYVQPNNSKTFWTFFTEASAFPAQ